MARLDLMPVHVRDHLLALPYASFETSPWVEGPPLKVRKVALISSAAAQGAATSAKLKMASEDLKAYYTEAVTAQPGRATDAASLADWFWGETAAAKVLNEVRKRCLESPDKAYKPLGNLLLVPRAQLHRFDA